MKGYKSKKCRIDVKCIFSISRPELRSQANLNNNYSHEHVSQIDISTVGCANI